MRVRTEEVLVFGLDGPKQFLFYFERIFRGHFVLCSSIIFLLNTIWAKHVGLQDILTVRFIYNSCYNGLKINK